MLENLFGTFSAITVKEMVVKYGLILENLFGMFSAFAVKEMILNMDLLWRICLKYHHNHCKRDGLGI